MTDIHLPMTSQLTLPQILRRARFIFLSLFVVELSALLQDLRAEGHAMNSRWAFGVMGHLPGVGEYPGGELSLRYGRPIFLTNQEGSFYGRMVAGIADGNGEAFGSVGCAYHITYSATTLEGGGVVGYFDGEGFGAGGEAALFQQVFNSRVELGGIARVLGESGGTEKEALVGLRFRFE